MSSLSFVLTSLAVLATASASQMTGDIFVFAYSWQAEFCYNQPTYGFCTPPQDYWKTHFTIHGLWPQYSTGGYPHDCTTEPFDPIVIEAVGWEDLTKYWPDAQYDYKNPDYDFWSHEWTKHGTCSGLKQVDYFQTTVNLAKTFGSPQILADAVGQNISASALRNSFGGASRASLQCNGGVYLSGVFTCWSTVESIPKAQIECPADVQKEDTCTSESIVVTSF